jgi:flagellar hook-length control protein FliK
VTEAPQPTAAPVAPAAGAPPGQQTDTPPADAFALIFAALAAEATGPPGQVAPASARTALAEGAEEGSDSPASPDKKDDATVPTDAATALAAALTAQAQPVRVAQQAATPAATTGAPVEAAKPTTAPVQADKAGDTTSQASGPATPDAGTAANAGVIPVPATATARPTHPSPKAPGDTVSQGVAAAAAAAAAKGRGKPAKAAHGAVDGTGAVKHADAPAQVGGENPAPTRVEKPVAAPAIVRPTAVARLQELPERLQSTIRVAIGEGRSDARITLRPVELGEVRIHLRYEAGGVSASVTTDSAAATQALANASSDLRRALEDAGVNLQSFDVREQAANQQGDGRRSGDTSAESRNGNSPFAQDDYDDEPTDVPLPEGVLVDVLA